MVRVLDRADVRRLVSMKDAIAAVREAFAAVDRGRAVMPAPFELHLPGADGELHVKGAYLAGSPVFVVKTATVRQAVAGSEVIITATSSTEPLVEAGWLARGAHVTAVGSDMPHKQELDPQVLAAADKYVPDSIEAAARSGELHHAIETGVLGAGSVYGELTALASGRLPGRAGEDELTVADLTGLGVQDAAVAALAARLAEERGAGRDLPLGGW